MESCGECSVCFCPMELTNMSVLPCGHTFHYECLYKCIDLSGFCPKCRRPSLLHDIIRKVFIELDEAKTSNAKNLANLTDPLLIDLKNRLISATITLNNMKTAQQATQEDLMFTRDQVRYMDGLYKGMKRQRDELLTNYRNLMERFCELESRFLYEQAANQPGTSNESIVSRGTLSKLFDVFLYEQCSLLNDFFSEVRPELLCTNAKDVFQNLPTTANGCLPSLPSVPAIPALPYSNQQQLFCGINPINGKNWIFPVQANGQLKTPQFQQNNFSNQLGQLGNSSLFMNNAYVNPMATNTASAFSTPSSSLSYNLCLGQEVPYYSGEQSTSGTNNLVYNNGMVAENNNTFDGFF